MVLLATLIAQRPTTLNALTGARFFAAIAVVIGHYAQRFGAASWIAPVSNLGPASVAFFYLLSGFVLTYNYADKSISWLDFMRARFARIYPTYALGLVLGLLALMLSGARLGVYGALSLPVNAVALQDWWPLPKAHIFNSPAWSISCEFFFYVCFLGILPIIRNRSFVRLATALFLIEGGALVIGFATVQHFVPSSRWAVACDRMVYRVPLFRIGEFVIGMALALWFQKHRKWSPAQCTITLVGGMAVIIETVWLAPVKASYATPWNPLIFFWIFIPVFAVMIIAMAQGRGFACRLLSLPWMLLMGESSYALYILHEPLLNLAQHFGITPLVSFGGTIALSVACFWYYEKPMRRHLRTFS